MAYATASDVETELGRPAFSAAETAQWAAWLARVERAIVRAFRRAGLSLDDQVALDDPTAEDVRDVLVAVVIRKIQNPTWGETSYTRSIDDASITTRREGGSGGDPLSLLDSDLSSLLPTRPGGARAFSVMPS
jgi:hypothetical protein